MAIAIWLWVQTPAYAIDWGDHESDRGVGVGGEFEEDPPGEAQPIGGGGGGGSSNTPPEDVTIGDAGTLVGLWGGGRCVSLNDGAEPTPEEEALLLDYITQHGLCEESEGGGGGGVVQTDPDEEALAVWTEVPLATPDPEIQPGWMVVGKPAYLETNSSLDTVTASTSTPLGQLELRADSHFRVDWDDEHDPGAETYTVEGAAWPDGSITHLYQHAGRHDVTVEQVWEASYRVGGGAWTDIPLERERSATLHDFEVKEVQAVRQD